MSKKRTKKTSARGVSASRSPQAQRTKSKVRPYRAAAEPPAPGLRDVRMPMEKFSSQMDAELLGTLREHARQTNQQIAGVLSDAVRAHLKRVQVRPVFSRAMDEVIAEHRELLEALAR